MDIYLIDGTYELFRHFYAVPSARDPDGREVGAVRGVLTSVLGMINSGVRYVAVATDHVIESFRNDLWPGYKTGAGIDPALYSQFSLLEEALTALGVVVWPMIEYEADDALAAGAALASADPRVDRVVICTPDKDLSQCVRGTRVGAAESTDARHARRGGRGGQVRRAPRVDSRLPRAGRRFVRRLPGPARVGSEVGGRSAGALQAPRSDS